MRSICLSRRLASWFLCHSPWPNLLWPHRPHDFSNSVSLRVDAEGTSVFPTWSRSIPRPWTACLPWHYFTKLGTWMTETICTNNLLFTTTGNLLNKQEKLYSRFLLSMPRTGSHSDIPSEKWEMWMSTSQVTLPDLPRSPRKQEHGSWGWAIICQILTSRIGILWAQLFHMTCCTELTYCNYKSPALKTFRQLPFFTIIKHMYVRLFPGIKFPDMSLLAQKICALFYIYGFRRASENLLLPATYEYINFLM